MEVIRRTLQEFCLSSGHKISQSKTKIYFSKNVQSSARRSICNYLGYSQTESLGKYLGVPLLNGRVSSNTYKYILERIHSKLAGWKSRSLSLAGRITLAKSVLSSVPLFTMQSVLLPPSCCNAIEKIIRKFIWGYSEDHRGVNLVKWSEICQPLKNGGCGILRLESQNRAFISKLIYQMLSQPDSLWVKVLKGKYSLGKKIDNNAIIRTNSSFFWRNITKLWQDTSFHVKWKPGDGNNLRFWSDYWVGDYGPLKNLSFAPISEPDLSRKISYYIGENGNWRWHLFHDLLPSNVLHEISSTKIEQNPCDPSCYWNLTSNGDFTTKSAYQATESLNWNVADVKWTRIWKLPMAQRVRTFTWLLAKGKLLTNSERYRRGMSRDSRCTLCNANIEDINHVFKDCPLASSVWKKILPNDMRIDFFRNDLIPWLINHIGDSSLHVSWKTGFCITCWKLWEARNHRIFTIETYTKESILAQIRILVEHTVKNFSIPRIFV